MPSDGPDLTVRRPATPEDADALADALPRRPGGGRTRRCPPIGAPAPTTCAGLAALRGSTARRRGLAGRAGRRYAVGLLLARGRLAALPVRRPATRPGTGHRRRAARPGEGPASRRARAVGLRDQRRRPAVLRAARLRRGTTDRRARTTRSGEPDIEMAWPDPASLAGLRRRIDAIDDRLAALLAERAGLTARVQQLKEVPGPRRSRPRPRGRDRRADGPARPGARARPAPPDHAAGDQREPRRGRAAPTGTTHRPSGRLGPVSQPLKEKP